MPKRKYKLQGSFVVKKRRTVSNAETAAFSENLSCSFKGCCFTTNKRAKLKAHSLKHYARQKMLRTSILKRLKATCIIDLKMTSMMGDIVYPKKCPKLCIQCNFSAAGFKEALGIYQNQWVVIREARFQCSNNDSYQRVFSISESRRLAVGEIRSCDMIRVCFKSDAKKSIFWYIGDLMEVVAETASFGNVLRLQELKVMKMKMNLQRSLKQLDSILKICEDQDLDRDERRAILE